VRVQLGFYSDADDPSLPAFKVIEPAPPGTNMHGWAQRKWQPGLVAALSTALSLGTKWTLVADDDTFVVPRNVLRVLQPYTASKHVLVGQKCGPLGHAPEPRAICGGAGWAMTTPLHRRLARALPGCAARYFSHGSWPPGAPGALKPNRNPRLVETQSDRFLSRCFTHELNVSLTDRAEFNSQPPLFYETGLGRQDRPRGFGTAATFHYLTAKRQRELMGELSDENIWWSVEHTVGAGRRRR
jgi:hypothetical protein